MPCRASDSVADRYLHDFEDPIDLWHIPPNQVGNGENFLSIRSSYFLPVLTSEFISAFCQRIPLLRICGISGEPFMNPLFLRPIQQRCLLSFAALGLLAGCFPPGMYRGYPPYGQPMYAPPQSINPGGPGSLYIPESNADPYVPGSTYDTDPDDFEKSRDDEFFNPDDQVPLPSDRESPFFDEDIPGSSTSIDPGVSAGGEQLVSHTEMPVEYGFDTADYRWLRGVVQRDPATGEWFITYSQIANDQFGGQFALQLPEQMVGRLHNGDSVDVTGQPHQGLEDRAGRTVYDVREIRPVRAAG